MRQSLLSLPLSPSLSARMHAAARSMHQALGICSACQPAHHPPPSRGDKTVPVAMSLSLSLALSVSYSQTLCHRLAACAAALLHPSKCRGHPQVHKELFTLLSQPFLESPMKRHGFWKFLPTTFPASTLTPTQILSSSVSLALPFFLYHVHHIILHLLTSCSLGFSDEMAGNPISPQPSLLAVVSSPLTTYFRPSSMSTTSRMGFPLTR